MVMNVKKKLLYVVPSVATGGGEKVVLELANNADFEKFDVYVLNYYKQTENMHSFDNLINDKIKFIFLDKKKGLDFSLFKKVKKVIKEIDPDIIHAHLNVLLYLIPSFKKKQKKFFTIHNIPNKEATGLQKLLRSYCFKFKGVVPVALSKSIGELIREYYHYDKEIPVVNNGISLTKATSSMDELKKDNFIILNAGNFKVAKDHFTLIEAFNKFQKMHDNARLWLLGDGVLGDFTIRKEIEKKIQEYNLNDKVILFGNVSNVNDYLKSADIFVLSSIYEGFPLCLLEALSEGLPIVSTDVGGISDIVVDGENGFLVKPKDSDAIVEKCDLLYNNKELREEISKNALKSSYKFDIKNCAKQYEELYLRTETPKKDNKKVANISIYLSFVVSILGVALSSIYFNKTSDYKFEKLSYDMFNYNEVTYLDNYDAAIMELSYNKNFTERNYTSLYLNLNGKFQKDKFIKDYRFMSTSPLKMSDSKTGNDYNISIISQNVFSQAELGANKFAFDFRKYATYYKVNVRTYANDFCFVSESLANKLLMAHKYTVNESNKIEMYSFLSAGTENNLDVYINDSNNAEKSFSYQVLGVIRSDYGSAKNTQKRVEAENADFILAYSPFKYGKYYDFMYEVDLKINPTGNKDTFNYFKRFLLDDAYNVKIKTKSSENKYIENEELMSKYKEACDTIVTDKKNTLYACIIYIAFYVIFFILSILYMDASSEHVIITFALYAVAFIIYGIISNFTFIYPYISLMVLMFVLYFVFVERKKIYETLHKCFKRKN